MVSSKSDKRRLVINLEKCIGCDACANSCHPHLITMIDRGSQRVLSFPIICAEDCTRCTDFCPEKAITFVPAPEVPPAEECLTVNFELFPCEQCKNPFTTRRIVDKLLATLPAEIGIEPGELAWLKLCPTCRQVLEGRSVTAKLALNHLKISTRRKG